MARLRGSEVRARSPRTLKDIASTSASRAVELLRAAGAREVVRANFPGLLIHLHSTMRMGTSASDSVLDADAEARWVKRLFVADNSALPNGVGGPNPPLTTQARSQPARPRRSSSATSAATAGSGASHRCRRWTTR